MTKVFTGDNSSQLYMNALITLLQEGDKLAPRGKEILELRPVVFEFTNPRNRVTMLNGRTVNPFFQLAEAWWILGGRSDVEWLVEYNKSISQFSDDGVHFNAPYGERLRAWGRNNASKFIFNPIDQLVDTYKKLSADPDTRQAVAFIGDPRFDNYEYTNVKNGKDIACNLNIKFKIRKGKLHATVDNRSNDLHWGVFGANLCQFTTILEVMASWLGVEVGTYTQITDSLHIYTQDYGAKETDNILRAYGLDDGFEAPISTPVVDHFVFPDEPKITSDYDTFHNIFGHFLREIEPFVKVEENLDNEHFLNSVANVIGEYPDVYIKMSFFAMVAYLAHKRKRYSQAIFFLSHMPDCQWKVLCLRFLSNKASYLDTAEFTGMYNHYNDDVKAYIERKGE